MNALKLSTCLLIIALSSHVSVAHAADTELLRKAAEAMIYGTNPSSSAKSSAPAALLSNRDIAAGLKEALQIGTAAVVSRLGKTDGFNLDPKIHIPLPRNLQKVDKALNLVGMGHLTDDLEVRINRAAEAATPKAKTLFVNSIKQMTFADARQILSGPNYAATQYLKRTMGPELNKEIQPLIKTSLAQSGALKVYDKVLGQYAQLPLASSVKGSLTTYAADKTLDGIFYYVAQEEAAIRSNPAKRTTDLLKKVFWQN